MFLLRFLMIQRVAITSILIVFCSFSVIAETDGTVEDSPEVLLNNIMEIFKNGCPHTPEEPKASCAADYRKQLVQHGDEAVQLILEQIYVTEERYINNFLLFCMANIESAYVDQILFDMFCDHESLSFNAANYIIWRAQHEIPFAIEVPEKELQKLLDEIDAETPITSVRIVALLKQNDLKTRIEPIIERFKREIFSPTQIEPVHGVFLSPRVFLLNPYLQAFKHFGVEAQPYIIKLHNAAKIDGDDEFIKWTGIALGMTGEQLAVDYLEDLIKQETDIYVKYVAIRAYSLSAKQQAIPLLNTLLKDESVSEYGEGFAGPFKIISSAAKSELINLQCEQKE